MGAVAIDIGVSEVGTRHVWKAAIVRSVLKTRSAHGKASVTARRHPHRITFFRQGGQRQPQAHGITCLSDSEIFQAFDISYEYDIYFDY